jgi:hypothetical protein
VRDEPAPESAWPSRWTEALSPYDAESGTEGIRPERRPRVLKAHLEGSAVNYWTQGTALHETFERRFDAGFTQPAQEGDNADGRSRRKTGTPGP